MGTSRLFNSTLNGRKLRRSHPRILIYYELVESKTPLSPREIYQRLLKKGKKVGLTSIYRFLEIFESLGVVFKIHDGSSVRYKFCELEVHHHHIVCKSCGNVVELNFCDISDWSRKISDSTGYQVIDHQLNFFGLCKECIKK